MILDADVRPSCGGGGQAVRNGFGSSGQTENEAMRRTDEMRSLHASCQGKMTADTFTHAGGPEAAMHQCCRSSNARDHHKQRRMSGVTTTRRLPPTTHTGVGQSVRILRRTSTMMTSVALLLMLAAVCTLPHCCMHVFVRADDDILAELLREETEQDNEYHHHDADAGDQDGESKYDRPPPDMNTGGGGGGMGGSKRNKMPGGGGNPVPNLEDQLRQKQEEAARAAAAQAEEEAARIAEQHRLQREAEFEAEVKRMDAEQRKRALKQKKIDARIVNRILRATGANPEPNHYAVLGLRNWEVHVGPWHLFRITTKDVKKAYRNLSRRVHPDKNRDGRAEQAFHALEASSAVLSDAEDRRGYDRRVEARRKKRNKRITGTTFDVLDSTRRNVLRVLGTSKRVLGPFSVPVFTLGMLALP